jgi:APA family basic amino acid/polyamine antiporter
VLEQLPGGTIALALWALAGIHALISANVVAEVMTALPKCGGMFVPAKAAFGPPGGLLIGWTDWLIQVSGIAALSIASGEFLAIVFPALAGHQGIVGAGISIGLFVINLAGVREGSALQIAGSSLKLLFLLALALAAFVGPGPTSASTAAAASSTSTGLSLWGVVVAYQLIVGVYSGWPNPIYFSEEDKQPSRNIPLSMLLSIGTVTALYLLINAALLYAVPLDQLRQSDLPVAAAIAPLFGPLSMKVVAAAAIVIVATCNNANIMVASRILYGLAHQGLFPSIAGHVNRGGTPHVALVLTAIVSILLTLTGKFELMFLVLGALSLVPLVATEVAFFKLRLISPSLPRPFRAIGYPFLPALALALDASVLLLFIASDWKSGLSIIAAVAICIPIGLWMQRRSIA